MGEGHCALKRRDVPSKGKTQKEVNPSPSATCRLRSQRRGRDIGTADIKEDERKRTADTTVLPVAPPELMPCCDNALAVGEVAVL